MNLPKIINPCPIHEAIIEIRFDSTLPPDAVFGVTYNELKDLYQTPERLPILQIPEVVRASDPNLIYQPHYRIKRENFLIQIGPKVLSLGCIEKYTGWDIFFSEALTVFNKIKELNFISAVTRFGIRYINIFEHEIIDHIKLQLTIGGNPLKNKETGIRTVFDDDNFKTILQIGNHLYIERVGKPRVLGSSIDIDVMKMESNIEFFENIESMLNEAHQIEKEKFFGLLTEDFLATLNPVY